MPMTPCDGTDSSLIWCCGRTTSCCGGDSEVHVLRNIYAVISTSTGMPSTSASDETLPFSTSNSTYSPIPSQSSSGLSADAKTGIGVGAGVGVSAMVALMLFFLRRHRRNIPAVAVP